VTSDDLEFLQIVAEELDLSSGEYESLLEEFGEAESRDWFSEYHLDPSWPDDDWLEAGEEWELSPDYTE
jgi:hypothetical protein